MPEWLLPNFAGKIVKLLLLRKLNELGNEVPDQRARPDEALTKRKSGKSRTASFPDTAAEYVGGVSIFDDLVKKKFVKPRVQRKGCTRYDRVELDHALDHWEGFGSE